MPIKTIDTFSARQWNRILGIILFIVIILAVTATCDSWKKDNAYDELNKSMNDSLTVYRDEQGRNHGRIRTLEAEKAEDFYKLATQDTTIQKLQKLVKQNEKFIKKSGIVGIVNTEAKVDVTIPTTVITETDSTGNQNTRYEGEFNLENWVYGSISASKDSTKISFGYREEMEIVVGTEPTGFLGLGKGKPFSDVTLNNPYNEVKAMRVYKTTLPKAKHFAITGGVYYGFDLLDLKPSLIIGAGISKTFIRF